MEGNQASQASGVVPVDWGHVKQADTQELDDILTSIMHGQPRLLVFAHTLGVNMVTEAFAHALKNYIPEAHHTIYIPAGVDFVTVYPIHPPPPWDGSESVPESNMVTSPTTAGPVGQTQHVQVQPANLSLPGTAQALPSLAPPPRAQLQANPPSYPAQAGASAFPTTSRPVVNPPHVSPDMRDPYVSPNQQASVKPSGAAVGRNPFDFPNKSRKGKK